MKFKMLIIGFFVFALTATAQAQHAPNTSRHLAADRTLQRQMNADAIAKRKVYNLEKRNRKVTVGKRITKADQKKMKKQNALLSKKHGKASRKTFKARKVETAKF